MSNLDSFYGGIWIKRTTPKDIIGIHVHRFVDWLFPRRPLIEESQVRLALIEAEEAVMQSFQYSTIHQMIGPGIVGHFRYRFLTKLGFSATYPGKKPSPIETAEVELN